MTAISVVGLEVLGVTEATELALRGLKTIGVDRNTKIVRELQKGVTQLAETDLPEQLQTALATGNLHFTSSLQSAIASTEITLINAGLVRAEGNPGLHQRELEETLLEIGAALHTKDDYHLIILRGTVAPGQCRDKVIPILERYSGKTCGEDFGFAYCPEVIRPGTVIADYRNPVTILNGAFDEDSADAIQALYRHRVGLVSSLSIEEAEVTRYVNLSWQAMKLEFASKMQQECADLGVSARNVLHAVTRDTKQNISTCYLVPHCPQPDALTSRIDDLWGELQTSREQKSRGHLRLASSNAS